jgi:hypothetical protein
MAYFKNTLSHAVRAGETRDTRIPAGGVVQVSDDDAQKYEGVNGVESASEQDYNSYREQSVVTADKTGDMVLQEEYNSTVGEAARNLVAAPLQVVVGDNEAPLGPPTGTRTTKRALMNQDAAHAAAFGPNEAREKVEEPEQPLTFATVPKSPVVYNQQVEQQEKTDELANRIVGVLDENTAGPGEVKSDEKAQEQQEARGAQTRRSRKNEE